MSITMEITYLGNYSFKFGYKNGMVVVCDPFDSKAGGMAYPKQKADIVTISGEDGLFNNVEGVSGPVKREDVFLINEEGEYEIGGIEIIAKKSYRDSKKGKEKGENLIMVIRQNGITVCHLGSLGHALSEKQVEALGSVDVLLFPIEGESTLGMKDIGVIISSMSPSIVIPMYRSKPVLKEFMEKNNLEVMLEGANKVKITTNTLPENTKVAALSSKN